MSNLKPVVNATVDFSLTKDDALVVLIEQESNRLTQLIDIITRKSKDNEDELARCKDRIESEVKSSLGYGEKFEVVGYYSEEFLCGTDKVLCEYSSYDLDSLAKSKKPSRVLKSVGSVAVNKIVKNYNFTLSTEIDGVKFTSVDIEKPIKRTKGLIALEKEYNSLTKKKYELYTEYYRLMRERAIVEAGEGIKSNFIKKVMESNGDLKELIKNLSGSKIKELES